MSRLPAHPSTIAEDGPQAPLQGRNASKKKSSARKRSWTKRLRAWSLVGHKWAGIIGGIPIFILAFTGLLLVYEAELRAWEESRYNTIEIPENEAPLPLSKLISSLETHIGEAAISIYYISNNSKKAYKFRTSDRHYYYINPYTGELTGETELPAPIMGFVRMMHTSFFMGDFGTWIAVISAFAFASLSLTGVVLFFKRRGGLFRKSRIRTHRGLNVGNFDFHAVVGFYASGVLAIIAISGALIGIGAPWRDFILNFTDSEWSERPQVLDIENYSELLPPEDLIERIDKESPEGMFATMAIFPQKPTDAFRVRYVYDWARRPASWGYAHPGTGEILDFQHFPDFELGHLIHRYNRAIHSGEAFTDLMRFAWFVLMIVTIALIISGYFIWRPFKTKKQK